MITIDPRSLSDTACRRLAHMYGQHAAQQPGPLRDFFHQLAEQLSAELDYREDVLHQCEVDLDADADAEGEFLGDLDAAGLAAYAERLQAEIDAEHAAAEHAAAAEADSSGPPRITGDGVL